MDFELFIKQLYGEIAPDDFEGFINNKSQLAESIYDSCKEKMLNLKRELGNEFSLEDNIIAFISAELASLATVVVYQQLMIDEVAKKIGEIRNESSHS